MILRRKNNWICAGILSSLFFSMHGLKTDYIGDDYSVVDVCNEGGKYSKHQHSKGSAALKRCAQGYNGKDFSPNRRNRSQKEKARAAAVAQSESAKFGPGYRDLGPIEPHVNSFYSKRGEANVAVHVYDIYDILRQTQQRIKGIIAQAPGLNAISTLHMFNRKHATILYTGKTETQEIEGVKKAIEHGIEDFCSRRPVIEPMCLKIGGPVQIYGEHRGAGKKFLGVPAALDDRVDELLQSIISHMPDGYKSAYRNLHVSLCSVEVGNDAQAQQLARLVFDSQVVAMPFHNIVDKVVLMPSQGRPDVDYDIELQPEHDAHEPVVINTMDLESLDENSNPFFDEVVALFAEGSDEQWKTIGTDVLSWGTI